MVGMMTMLKASYDLPTAAFLRVSQHKAVGASG
jgi:hypothetical protein